MSPWTCVALILTAGSIGGVVNALLSDNGFILPRRENGIWCPGILSNILIGALSAFISWAFYGSGAAIELAVGATTRDQISLKIPALAGACLVGVAGAKWLTNEVDKRLLKKSVEIAGHKNLSPEDCSKFLEAPAREVLRAVEQA